MKIYKDARQGASVKYRRAGILDVPLIFDLIAEGAVAGAFSDSFVRRTGCVSLLWLILRSVVMERFQPRQSNFTYAWKIVVGQDGKDVGFLKRSRYQSSLILELLAISPAFRNRGIGTAVVEAMAAEVPTHGQLIVHCTKFARAMQHILKRHSFKRNVRLNVPRLEEYASAPIVH